MDSYSNDPASDLFLDSSCELKWPIQSLAGTRAVQKHSYTPPVDRISISKDHETIFCQTKYLRCASDILDTETRCVGGGGHKILPPSSPQCNAYNNFGTFTAMSRHCATTVGSGICSSEVNQAPNILSGKDSTFAE